MHKNRLEEKAVRNNKQIMKNLDLRISNLYKNRRSESSSLARLQEETSDFKQLLELSLNQYPQKKEQLFWNKVNSPSTAELLERVFRDNDKAQEIEEQYKASKDPVIRISVLITQGLCLEIVTKALKC